MTRSAALAVLALVLLVGGAWLGLSDVGSECGSAFSPDYSTAQFMDSVGSGSGRESDCRDAVSARKPWAFGGLGLGALALVLSFAIPDPEPPTQA